MKQYFHAIAVMIARFCAPGNLVAEEAGSWWTGTYVGFGAASSHMDTSQHSPAQRIYSGYHAADYDGSHLYGFLQAGVRRQIGSVVLGWRLRHQMTSSDGDSFLKVDEVLSSKAASVTTFAGTLGYLAQPKLLIYASAGVAYGRFDYGSVDERWSQVDDSLKDHRTGYALGLGAEYQLSDRLSIFSEYSFTKFREGRSTFQYGSSSYTPSWTYDFAHELSEVQIGVNLRF